LALVRSVLEALGKLAATNIESAGSPLVVIAMVRTGALVWL
jgi:hypothetical protein